MRAVLCNAWGPPESLVVGEWDAPRPREGELRIAVRACGVNFADTLMIEGRYQERPDLPFVPGLEIAGDVVEVGPGVSGFSTGDRVMAQCGRGGFAEEAIARGASTVRIPGAVDYVTAASVGVAYGTAHVGLDRRVSLRAGERLLVLGAAGGVGLAAVEVGGAMGAEVIACASTEDKRDLALERGAAHALDPADGLRDAIKDLTGGQGVDVVFDPVGGDLFREGLRCLAWEGRLLVIGFASGAIPEVPAGLLLVKNVSAVGLYWGAYARKNPQALRESWQTLLGWLESGAIRPHVSETFPLGRAAEALTRLASREATGKVVLTVDDGG